MHTKDDGPHLTHDELVAMGYDRRDVNLKTIRRAIVIFFIFGAACWGITYVLLNGVRFWFIDWSGIGGGFSAVKGTDGGRPRKVPALPNPLLQNNVTAKADMMEMRQSEDKILGGYTYADTAKTKVIIPIETAKELLLQKGVSVGAEMDAANPGNTSGQKTAGRPTTVVTPAGANGGTVPTNPATQATSPVMPRN